MRLTAFILRADGVVLFYFFTMFKAALFDLDGVVFDTESQYTVFWDSVFSRYYPDRSGLARKIKGQTLDQILTRYFASDNEARDFIVHELDKFESSMSYEYIAGFQKFIREVRGLGIRTAVVTSSNKKKMAQVYSAHPEFELYFDKILTSENFKKSKPDPDCYLRGAEALGVSAVDCVGFEDSFNGLRALKASGAYVVGLATTNPAGMIRGYAGTVIPNYVGLNETFLKKIYHDHRKKKT